MLRNFIIALFLLSCVSPAAQAQEEASTTYFEYYDDGKVKMAVSLEGEVLQGAGKMYYPNGTLMCDFYMENGAITEVMDFYNEDGTLSNDYIKYADENGALLFEGQMLEGKPNGEFVAYRPDGSVAVKFIYDKGKVVETITPE